MKKSDRALIIAVFGLLISLAGFAVISVCWSIKEAAVLTPVAALNAYRILTELRERKKTPESIRDGFQSADPLAALSISFRK